MGGVRFNGSDLQVNGTGREGYESGWEGSRKVDITPDLSPKYPRV